MKIFYIISAFGSLGLGVIGILLPILPTTPFILLTLYLLGKGSTKYYNWFTSLPFYKKHIQSFYEKQTMTFRQKWTLLLFVDAILLITFIQLDSIPLRILLIVLFLYKHYYFNKHIKVV